MLNTFHKIKKTLIKKIISNPYDEEREFFVKICKDKIPYLASMPDTFIK